MLKIHEDAACNNYFSINETEQITLIEQWSIRYKENGFHLEHIESTWNS